MTGEADAQRARIAANGWEISPEVYNTLTPTDIGGIEHELAASGRTLENYCARLRQLGMTGKDRVIDFGCGFGQWSIALATLNDEVIGIDKSEQRLALGRQLARSMKAGNVAFQPGLTGKAAEDESADAVICYSVLMFIDGASVLREFHRILKPGGQLYVMVDLPAWHLRSLFRHPMNVLSVGYMALNTLLRRKRNIIYTRKSIETQIMSAGFDIVSSGLDYSSSFSGSIAEEDKIAPLMLPQRQFGLPLLHEVCARRS